MFLGVELHALLRILGVVSNPKKVGISIELHERRDHDAFDFPHIFLFYYVILEFVIDGTGECCWAAKDEIYKALPSIYITDRKERELPASDPRVLYIIFLFFRGDE